MKNIKVGQSTVFVRGKTILAKLCFLLALLLTPLKLSAASQTPLSYFAIFYQNLLEFSTCATMTINGPVHCNTNIYVGAGSAATLTFNNTVNAHGSISAPPNNGANWGYATNYNSGWRTIFNGNPGFVTNSPIIYTSLGLTDPHMLIDIPPASEDPNTLPGSARLYNQAQVILTVSNFSPITTNIIVAVKIQRSPGLGQVNGADPAPILMTYTNPTSASLSNSLPFLSLTNRFYDRREGTTNLTTQIDLGKYRLWLTNSSSPVTAKYTSLTPDDCPTILFVADNRNTG
jgi:hypothetical protein